VWLGVSTTDSSNAAPSPAEDSKTD
jgi:hypothetical protein